MDIGPPELIIILVIVLVLFGGAKLPKLAKSLGEAQREFKRGTNGEKDDADAKVVETTVVEAPKAETVVVEKPASTDQTTS